ncbi:MAG: CHASE2 domain-containing protein [Phormidesmis sp.]
MKRTQANQPILGSSIFRPTKSLDSWQANLFLPGMVVILLVLLARAFGWIQVLELKTLDIFLRIRPTEPKDERILIVGIDEDDIQQTGAYPIPDQTLANLLQQLSQHNPRSIGLDIIRDLPVEPGHAQLKASLKTLPNLVGIERISSDWVKPHTLLPTQVGFVDFPHDPDGFIRRTYLEALPPESHPDSDRWRGSFAFVLAARYLAASGFELENGQQNPENPQFGETELFGLRSNSGSYVGVEPVGVQMLINVRSGPEPFEIVSMTDVLDGRIGANRIEDRVVLIGITSLTVKDVLNSGAVNQSNPGLVNGVEMHAHIVSQLISTVMDNRQMITVWPDAWEYLWIVLAGGVGILLPRFILRPVRYVLAVLAVSFLLVGGSVLGLWLVGWWIPVVPSVGIFLMNAGILPAFYVYDRTLRSRIEERQRVIEHSYDNIHSGPLQTLALLLKNKETLDPAVAIQLETLNRELRQVYERLLQKSVPYDEQLSLGNQHLVDLRHPLHEILYEVYTETLTRDFPGFKTIKFKVVKFEPLQTVGLGTDEKQALCRFLEEALCNVGKHALGTKRLTVHCSTTDTENVIRVEDNSSVIRGNNNIWDGIKHGLPVNDSTMNGLPESSFDSRGRGTQQATAIAQRLGGHFQRYALHPGTACELRWPRSPAPSEWYKSRQDGKKYSLFLRFSEKYRDQ